MNRPWMPWYIGDYLKDTMNLTCEQHGAYLLLLAHCWQNNGTIPSRHDKNALSRITKTTIRRWNAIGPTVMRFFNEDGTNKRVSKELERVETISIKRKISAAKGGLQSVISRARHQSNGQAIGSNKFKQLVDPNSSNSQHNHKVSKKEPSKEASASEALLEVCKAKGWVE